MIKFNQRQEKQLAIYYNGIVQRNVYINLTTITDKRMFHVKHVLDSLACAQIEDFQKAELIADLGTGAGFPGVPLAVAFPNKEFILIDALEKRLRVIEELCSEAEISNIKTVHARAEDIGRDKKYREKCDFCVARAVAVMPVLTEWCMPLVKVGGIFAAYKGERCEGEIDAAAMAIEIMGGEVEDLIKYGEGEEEISGHALSVIRKVKHTPAIYPRKPGEARRRPIV